MKLYYSPGACSLAPHIIIQELGLSVELEQVNLTTHLTETGQNYYEIHPRGQVPCLQLDSGELLCEGPVITQYIAEQAGETTLYPRCGTLARFRVHEWQNYITSELHKSFTPLFHTEFNAEQKAVHAALLLKKYQWLNSHLQHCIYLSNDQFSLADAYFFTVTQWAKWVELDLSPLTHIQSYMSRIAARPSVQAALRAEGLI